MTRSEWEPRCRSSTLARPDRTSSTSAGPSRYPARVSCRSVSPSGRQRCFVVVDVDSNTDQDDEGSSGRVESGKSSKYGDLIASRLGVRERSWCCAVCVAVTYCTTELRILLSCRAAVLSHIVYDLSSVVRGMPLKSSVIGGCGTIRRRVAPYHALESLCRRARHSRSAHLSACM